MAGFGTQNVWSLLDVRLLGSVCLSVCVHTTNLQKVWVLLCEANLNACMCMKAYICTCMKPVCVGNVCEAMHVCVCMEGGHIHGHVECVGHCGLAYSAQGPLPPFEEESDSQLLAGMPCGVYFCLGAH